MNFGFLSDFLSENSAILICTDVNRRYLTSFPSSLGYLLLTKKESLLLVDGRYFTAAKQGVKNNIRVVLLEKLCEQLNEYLNNNSINLLFVESEISVGQFQSLKEKLNCNVKASCDLSSALLEKRSVKQGFEVEFVIEAQQIAEKAFEEILNYIKVGVSERDIALQLDYMMRKSGSEGVSFDTICVSGANSALPHGVPSGKLIENGDFVTMDFGAVYGGYHSDMTRTVAVSHVTDDMKKVYDTVLEAQCAAVDSIKSGILCCDVDKTARDIIDKAGYKDYYNHGTGHGVGLEIHEYPNLSPKCKNSLVCGQIVTCEPGIYLPNKFGVRIEDMVLVKNNCSQNLTKAAKKLIIL